MGEISEMMMDGTLCNGCGVYLGTPVGYPCYCKPCRKDRTTSSPAASSELSNVYPSHPDEEF